MTTRWYTIHYLSNVSGEAHPPYSSDLAPCDLFISKDQASIKRNLFRARRCSEGKGDGGYEEVIRQAPTALLPTVKNSHGAV
jgi:hypothetical protein